MKKIEIEKEVTPDPEQGFRNLERLFEKLDKEEIEFLTKSEEALSQTLWIISSSQFLANILIRRPQYLTHLFSEKKLYETKVFKDFLKELLDITSGTDDFEEMASHLRIYKQREYLRIGARDLLNLAYLEETVLELSDLASASLEVAYRFSLRKLKEVHGAPYEQLDGNSVKEARFVVIGMGKLGGRELNFSSDIDILYLYSSDDGETEGVNKGGTVTGKIDLPTFYIKLSRSITKLIGSSTGDGIVFRVDLDLRPEGKSGDLAGSLRSMEIYYESWGETWERGALLKARPVAGSIPLGEEFLEMVRPFVYRRYLDYTAIDEIRGMKEKIDFSYKRKGRGLFDVKLGKGGIREIEFFIQTIQLINGGKDLDIREKNSLKGLDCLRKKGYISSEEEDTLRKAYIFLRKVEHRLQIFHGRQTHSLPDNPETIEKVAKTLRIEDNPYDSFMEKLKEVTGDVHRIYSRLFYEPSKKLEQETSKELLYLSHDEEGVLGRLEDYGFRDPEKALQNLKLLKTGPSFAHYSARTKTLLQKIAPFLLTKIVSSPAPDMALSNMEKFISCVGARTTILALLAENRNVMEALVQLFGTSAFLSRFLIEHLELLDSFITYEMGIAVKDKGEMYKELSSMIDGLSDYEEQLNSLRRFRNMEMLMIGIRDINGDLDPVSVSCQISDIADTCLQKAYEIAMKELYEKFGVPSFKGEKGEYKKSLFAILGLGKLGGRELIYGSDLDVIFVYSHSGETRPYSGGDIKTITNHEFFARLAQKIISIISLMTQEGFVFKVDTRLRPSGSSGPLITSLSAFEEYHREKALVWEKQAMIRARLSAGDVGFGKEVISLARELIYESPIKKEDEKEINRLRMRMESELGKESEKRIDMKFGRGGLVDIEFIVQLLQLRYGKMEAIIRGANTLSVLKALKEKSFLSLKDYNFLKDSYSFYRLIENRLRIAEDRAGSLLVLTDPSLERLCRGLGYKKLEKFVKEYKKRAAGVREIYKRVFGDIF